MEILSLSLLLLYILQHSHFSVRRPVADARRAPSAILCESERKGMYILRNPVIAGY